MKSFLPSLMKQLKFILVSFMVDAIFVKIGLTNWHFLETGTLNSGNLYITSSKRRYGGNFNVIKTLYGIIVAWYGFDDETEIVGGVSSAL